MGASEASDASGPSARTMRPAARRRTIAGALLESAKLNYNFRPLWRQSKRAGRWIGADSANQADD